MDKWFQEPTFGKRCLSALENSAIYRDGFVDREYVMGLLRGQVEGRINYGFHLWTVMNAVFWHERWIERRLAA
jgi:asparagine synthase (glutamine-hydrolysing)